MPTKRYRVIDKRNDRDIGTIVVTSTRSAHPYPTKQADAIDRLALNKIASKVSRNVKTIKDEAKLFGCTVELLPRFQGVQYESAGTKLPV